MTRALAAGARAHRPRDHLRLGGLRCASRGSARRTCKLTEADYAWVTRELVAVAARTRKGRIVSALEGGYALSALGRSAAEHVRELRGRLSRGTEARWSGGRFSESCAAISAVRAGLGALPGGVGERAAAALRAGAPRRRPRRAAQGRARSPPRRTTCSSIRSPATPCFLLQSRRGRCRRRRRCGARTARPTRGTAASGRRARSSRSPRSARTSSPIRRATSRSSATSRSARRPPTRT